MEPDELALSDVHVYGPSLTGGSTAYKDYQVAKTRFIYTLDIETSEEDPDSEVSSSGSPASQCSLELDEEGDVIVKRNTKANVEVLTIEHTMATRLPDVGLQVWQGCLLLCDYILDNSTVFKDEVVLELGGGTGLASIVMATVAKAVICTDIGEEVLTLCRKNIETHRDLYVDKTVIVRELNWNTGELKTGSGDDGFTWNKADVELFQRVHVIIAADVIYDDNLTDNFFNTVSKLMCKKPGMKTIIALEKRLNFTLSDLEVSCPAYNHFKEHLAQLSSADEESDVEFIVLQFTDIQQFFYYDRSKYLELWEITSQVKKKSSSS